MVDIYTQPEFYNAIHKNSNGIRVF